MDAPVDFDAFVSQGLEARRAASFIFAAMTVVLYDHYTTLDSEIELIWMKKWSLVKGLFLVNRYVPTISYLFSVSVNVWSPEDRFIAVCMPPVPQSVECRLLIAAASHQNLRCPYVSKVQTWLSVIALQCLQAILVHRTICMYRQKPLLVRLLSIVFGLNLLLGFIFAGLSMNVVNIPIFFTPTTRTCVPLGFGIPTSAMWFQMLIFETLIFGLALAEGIRYMRDTKVTRSIVPSIRERWTKDGGLIYILLRDSIIFPLITVTITLFNILAMYVFDQSSMVYTINLAAASSPVLGCRLILHLRDAYYQPFSNEMNQNGNVVNIISDSRPPEPRTMEMPEFALDTLSSARYSDELTGKRSTS